MTMDGGRDSHPHCSYNTFRFARLGGGPRGSLFRAVLPGNRACLLGSSICGVFAVKVIQLSSGHRPSATVWSFQLARLSSPASSTQGLSATKDLLRIDCIRFRSQMTRDDNPWLAGLRLSNGADNVYVCVVGVLLTYAQLD